MEKIVATVYIKNDCRKCDELLEMLEKLRGSHSYHMIVINVDEDPAYKGKFEDPVPYLQIGPYRISDDFTKKRIEIALNAAHDRATQIERIKTIQKKDNKKDKQLYSSSDRISHWLSRHYLFLINFVLFMYVGLPFLAPIFMKAGLEIPGKAIYFIYKPLCHQLAFRSWFLFGKQPVYPRSIANLDYPITYESIVGSDEMDPESASKFIGNQTLGYKVALCQRDVAIWGSLVLTGIIFSISGKKLRSIPWYIWLIFGVIPIGLDGGSQFLGYAVPFLEFIPIRESTPVLRTITGSLFGILTGWYLFPLIEESMVDAEQILTRKQKIEKELSITGK